MNDNIIGYVILKQESTLKVSILPTMIKKSVQN